VGERIAFWAGVVVLLAGFAFIAVRQPLGVLVGVGLAAWAAWCAYVRAGGVDDV
jgi:hypothetical protein